MLEHFVTVAWRPFLEPLPIDDYWMAFFIPMAISIAVVYKTIRAHEMRIMPRQAAVLATQIIVFFIAAAAALWLVTDVIAR